MIRDPSDGSVREEPSKVRVPSKATLAIGIPMTGLPPPDKDQINEAARLQRSRKWLEEYHKRKS